MPRASIIIGHLAATFCLACLPGCEEPYSSESAEPSEAAETAEPAEQPAPGPSSGGGGSALSGARRTAGDTVGDLQDRSNEIAEELDDQ
jgi:hypothetical protein